MFWARAREQIDSESPTGKMVPPHKLWVGTIFPVGDSESICSLARAQNIPVHLDGARLFNAAVALRRKPDDLARPFDSLMICLSKGLGAPVGSVLCGPKGFIDEGLRVRKRLGGGMRQAGVLAAAGLVALQENVERLAEDHQNALRLAEGISGIRGLSIESARVQTNIVVFEVVGDGITAKEVVGRWKEEGVLALAIDETQVRAVTHYDVDRAGVERALAILAKLMHRSAARPS